jgi:hypothetical protein
LLVFKAGSADELEEGLHPSGSSRVIAGEFLRFVEKFLELRRYELVLPGAGSIGKRRPTLDEGQKQGEESQTYNS